MRYLSCASDVIAWSVRRDGAVNRPSGLIRGATMASKRSTRTSRPADQEKAIGVHDRRDDVATKRRLLLTAAAVVVVLTGAFAGKRLLGDVSPMKHALTGQTFAFDLLCAL